MIATYPKTDRTKGLLLTNAIIVKPGDDLAAKYDWLKSSSRDAKMGAASENNRRTLVLTPGNYSLASTFVLDTNYVDIAGMTPNPHDTVLEGPSGSPAVRQDVCGIVLAGFTIAGNSDGSDGSHGFVQRQFNTTTAVTTLISGNLYKITATGIGKGVRHPELNSASLTTTGDFVKVSGTAADGYYELQWHATELTDDSVVIDAAGMNETSNVTVYLGAGTNRYYGMHFTAGQAFSINMSGKAEYIYSGQFHNCTGDDYSFRGGSGYDMYANHYDCHGGMSSFFGDLLNSTPRGRCIGCTAGDYSFGGCIAFGGPIGAEALFINCKAGINSFGLGNTVAGTFISCVGGANSFAGNVSGIGTAIFSGTAINCIVDGEGGFTASNGSGNSAAKITGTLRGCLIPDIKTDIKLEGATIENSRIESTTDGLFELLDSNSSVYNCTLLVLQGGADIQFNASLGAQSIAVAHCRMNNASNDSDGFALFCTNSIGTPYNVVDDNIV